MNILATIAARGGSKGVKKKNIREINGKPLIAYSIEQILEWNKFTHLIISTDSDEISDVCKSYGIDVLFKRPEHLSGDRVPKMDVLRHALIESEKSNQINYDYIFDFDVTCPLRNQQDIEGLFQQAISNNAGCTFSVTEGRRNPYFNMIEKSYEGVLSLCKKMNDLKISRQTCPTVYDMNNSMYVYRRDFLNNENNKMVYCDKFDTYLMADHTAFDIDTEFDLELVSIILEKYYS
jgi:CMP-N,N'-diacetyllegionaminic acid synthase